MILQKFCKFSGLKFTKMTLYGTLNFDKKYMWGKKIPKFQNCAGAAGGHCCRTHWDLFSRQDRCVMRSFMLQRNLTNRVYREE